MFDEIKNQDMFFTETYFAIITISVTTLNQFMLQRNYFYLAQAVYNDQFHLEVAMAITTNIWGFCRNHAHHKRAILSKISAISLLLSIKFRHDT